MRKVSPEARPSIVVGAGVACSSQSVVQSHRNPTTNSSCPPKHSRNTTGSFLQSCRHRLLKYPRTPTICLTPSANHPIQPSPNPIPPQSFPHGTLPPPLQKPPPKTHIRPKVVEKANCDVGSLPNLYPHAFYPRLIAVDPINYSEGRRRARPCDVTLQTAWARAVRDGSGAQGRFGKVPLDRTGGAEGRLF